MKYFSGKKTNRFYATLLPEPFSSRYELIREGLIDFLESVYPRCIKIEKSLAEQHLQEQKDAEMIKKFFPEFYNIHFLELESQKFLQKNLEPNNNNQTKVNYQNKEKIFMN